MHRACNRDAASSTICRQEERVGGTLDFDLHDLGAEPGQRFGDRRAGLELGEIDDFDAGKGRFAAWGAAHLRILHVEPATGSFTTADLTRWPVPTRRPPPSVI